MKFSLFSQVSLTFQLLFHLIFFKPSKFLFLTSIVDPSAFVSFDLFKFSKFLIFSSLFDLSATVSFDLFKVDMKRKFLFSHMKVHEKQE